MAKKKKPQPRKKAEPVAQSSTFWPLAGAILMFLLAAFQTLGMFGTGGPLPTALYEAVYSSVGWAGFLVPVTLVTWGYHKFKADDHQIPLVSLVSMIGLIVTAASWFHVAFVGKDALGNFTGGHGGAIGSMLGGIVLGALDKIPASLMFFVFSMLLFMLSYNISPKVLLKVFGIVKRPKAQEQSEGELAELKSKAQRGMFKLNEGVPVEHSQSSPTPTGTKEQTTRLSSLKNTAQKLTSSESHQALTVANDPDWKFPSVDLLNQKQDKANPGDVNANAETIRETLNHFNIDVTMEGANVGPRVTQFTLKPPSGVRLNKITALESNIALDLGAQSLRMEAPIPGQKAVGIEVPNIKSATVRLSGVFNSKEWNEVQSSLGIVIGRDIAGKPVVASLAKMPHLLVAGQTGSGKSVMINTILTSLLYNHSPAELKLILVDPKQVEMAPYEDIPHLLTPVITEPEKCISALKWAVAEMERRYRTLAENKKRNIAEFNALKDEESMPYVVIVIDELADLMMMAARDVEALIVRIAQKARAVGIHLVLATQRPSVDVITGLIKANVPARIAFTVASQIDSRTIIDGVGAEKLLGMGDMLFSTSDMPKPKRVQGALITDEETNSVTDFLRMQRPPQYDDEVVSQPVQLNGKGGVVVDHGGQDADDDMFRDAVRAVIESRKASTSLLQRRLRIGYGRAARLIETMEEQGIISHADGNRPRDVLVSSMDEVFGGGESVGSSPEEDTMYDENFS